MSKKLSPSLFVKEEQTEHSKNQENYHDSTFNSNSKFRRGIYLLPNIITLSGLFAGFYAIIAAIQNQFEAAIISLTVAMIMDFLDGRIARLTHTQSIFGAELDSLADIVSFGLTPAIITYIWALSSLGKIGWLLAFLFTAGGALRLARFNAQEKLNEKFHFEGLPTPAAAGLLIMFVWLCIDSHFSGSSQVSILLGVLVAMSSLLMVSNLHYPNFKRLNFKGHVPFLAIVGVMLGLAGIALDPPKVLFGIFLIYALSAPVQSVYRYWNIQSRLSLNHLKNNPSLSRQEKIQRD